MPYTNSNDWVPAEWDNLLMLSAKLERLLKNPLRGNPAWETQLRLTIETLSMFYPDIYS